MGSKSISQSYFIVTITITFFSLSKEDLWSSLSHASSKPVADVMETWTKQMGYPVLSVTAEQVRTKLTKLRSFRSPWQEEKTIFKGGGEASFAARVDNLMTYVRNSC